MTSSINPKYELKSTPMDELKELLNSHRSNAKILKEQLDKEQGLAWGIEQEITSRDVRYKPTVSKEMLGVLNSNKDKLSGNSFERLSSSFNELKNMSGSYNKFYGYSQVLNKYTIDLTYMVRNQLTGLYDSKYSSKKSEYHVVYEYDNTKNKWVGRIVATLFSKNGTLKFKMPDSEVKKMGNILRKNIDKEYKDHKEMALGLIKLSNFIERDYADYVLAFRLLV